MPKHKPDEGGTATLDPPARGMTAREALALACELEDLAHLLAPLARTPKLRKAVARLREVSEDLEDLADVEAVRKARAERKRTGDKSIPWEDVKRELGL